MSSSTLIPEHPLLFFPSLAATLGLEEAVLLQQLSQVSTSVTGELEDGYRWVTITTADLLRLFPFWSAVDLQRICNQLVATGVLLSDNQGLATSSSYRYAINEKADPASMIQEQAPQAAPPPNPAASQTSREVTSIGGARRLTMDWKPSADMLEYLRLNHGVDPEFSQQQLEDFLLYWRERAEVHHAWDNKFRQHVLSRWRAHQQALSEQRIVAPSDALDRDWRPHQDALDILLRDGISSDFIDDAVPEFVLYWCERPGNTETPNSKFVGHIRRQWRRFQATVAGDGEPDTIPAGWQPISDVYDILAMANIDADFARTLIPEFVVYWKDSGQLQSSWSTKFLQHVKYQWARRHELVDNSGTSHAEQQRHRTGSTRARSIAQDLTDRSWAT